jgi:hypothetical protein
VADARRRELERLAAAGDPGAERELLLERVRQGEVTPQAVRVAAYLGQPAALAAQPDAGPAGNTRELVPWLEGLAGLDAALLTRAALAAARYAYESAGKELVDPRLDKGLAAVEEWLACPCEPHRVAARLAAEEADEAAREASVLPASSDEAAFSAFAVRNAALTAAALRPVDALQEAVNAFLDGGSALDDDAALREEARRTLVAWALG